MIHCSIEVPYMLSAVLYCCAEPTSLLEWMLDCCHCSNLSCICLSVCLSQESGSASVDGGVDAAKVAELEKRLAAQSAETQKLQVRQKALFMTLGSADLVLSALF